MMHRFNRYRGQRLSFSSLSSPVPTKQKSSGVHRNPLGRLSYIPQGYETSYDYPLIVWMFDSAREEQNFWHWMPIVSDRNYVAVSMRSLDSPRLTMNQLHQEIERARSTYSIHEDRIFLIGVNHAAIHGQEVFDRQQTRFAGYFQLFENKSMRTELLSIDRSIMQMIDTAVHPE